MFKEPHQAKDDDTQQEGGSLRTVIDDENGHNVGLVVESIFGISYAACSLKGQASRPGVDFTAVMDGKASEFVDVKYVIRSAIPDVFKEKAAEPAMA